MQYKELEELIKELCQKSTLPEALDLLIASENADISEAATSLKGQFALAEVEGESRIYHVTLEEDDNGEEQEYLEHIMNEGEHVIKFIAWFFELQFDLKQKEIYELAGKTYQQPKRS